MSDSYFKEKVALVTGVGGGIGRTTALHLAQNGCKVMLSDYKEERLIEVYNSFSSKGYQVAFQVAEITSEADCKYLVEKTISTFGKLDILLPFAARSMRERFENLNPETIKQVIESNIYGTTFPILFALPYLKKTHGSVIIAGSVAGLHGLPQSSIYCMGKMSLTALAQSLQIELAESGVHVGILYIGFTENDENKTVLKGDGSRSRVAFRSKWMQHTQDQVAVRILDTIKSRKKKVVLTRLGKTNAFMVKYFPGLVGYLFAKSVKKSKMLKD